MSFKKYIQYQLVITFKQILTPLPQILTLLLFSSLQTTLFENKNIKYEEFGGKVHIFSLCLLSMV